MLYHYIIISCQFSLLLEETIKSQYDYKEIGAIKNNYNLEIDKLISKRTLISKDVNKSKSILTTESNKIEELKSELNNKLKQLKDLQLKLSTQNALNYDLNQLQLLFDKLHQLQKETSNVINLNNAIKEQLNNWKNNANFLCNIDSKIISKQNQIELIKEWLEYKERIDFELLYRLSSSSKSYAQFHNKCDQYHHTLVLILLDTGTIIGGYLSINRQGQGYKKDPYSFIFNLDERTKYSIKDDQKACYTEQYNFFEFGEGDLKVYGKQVTSNFPTSFGNINSKKYALTNGKPSQGLIDFELFHLYYYD